MKPVSGNRDVVIDDHCKHSRTVVSPSTGSGAGGGQAFDDALDDVLNLLVAQLNGFFLFRSRRTTVQKQQRERSNERTANNFEGLPVCQPHPSWHIFRFSNYKHTILK
mgnify:CR=1 FL=1